MVERGLLAMVCAIFFFFRVGASCHGRRDEPWSSWMLVALGYEWQIHSHIDCYISLGGVSVPILVIGCSISSLDYTKQGFSFQDGLIVVCHTFIEMDTWIFQSVSSLMFDRYLPLMKSLQVDWLLRRHQFSSIPDSAAESRMLSLTCIMLALRFFCGNYSMMAGW